jgi:hypothetical protein
MTRNLNGLSGAELIAAIREVKAALGPGEHIAMSPDGEFVIIGEEER